MIESPSLCEKESLLEFHKVPSVILVPTGDASSDLPSCLQVPSCFSSCLQVPSCFLETSSLQSFSSIEISPISKKIIPPEFIEFTSTSKTSQLSTEFQLQHVSETKHDDSSFSSTKNADDLDSEPSSETLLQLDASNANALSLLESCFSFDSETSSELSSLKKEDHSFEKERSSIEK